MKKKTVNIIFVMVLMVILLLVTACTEKEPLNRVGIEIAGINSSIGVVGDKVDDFETQSFQYTITLSNNEATDIKIVSISPILSEEFLERVITEDTTIQVNKTIFKENYLNVSGEIIFDAKGLSKEQIIDLEPFINGIKIIEERVIEKAF